MRVILFNLMPYRERIEKKKKRAVIIQFVSCAVFTGILCLSITGEFSSRIEMKKDYINQIKDVQNNINTRVKEVQDLQAELDGLRKKVSTIQLIEQQAVLSSTLLATLDKTIPKGTALTKVSFTPDQVQLTGRTSAINDLAAWVGMLNGQDGAFTQAQFVSLKKTASTDQALAIGHEFEIVLTVNPKLSVIAEVGNAGL